MALSYNLGYQESISVQPTRRQIFAGKPYSTFPNIWEWLIYCFELYVLKLNKEHMKTAGVDLGKGQIFKIKTKVTEMKTLIDIGKT